MMHLVLRPNETVFWEQKWLLVARFGDATVVVVVKVVVVVVIVMALVSLAPTIDASSPQPLASSFLCMVR